MQRSTYLSSVLILLILGSWSCQRNVSEEPASHLGEVHFRPAGKDAAQPFFQEGLLLLHSFEYADAKKAFARARELDPAMAMAYWGEAMTYNHPLWRQQDREAAVEVLNSLAPTPEARRAKTGSELEADLMAAADILYGAGEKVARDSAYAVEMKRLYDKYPEQQEVAAFYALSLLGAVPVGRDYEAYGKGAQIAKGILAENPNHPGALHYLIHAYDDPNHAALAIQAADSYAKVAPDAAHALHMPSHIYVAMGMWDEVIRSNIASYEASVNRMERLGLDHDARSYHAFSWLMYGYLQKEQWEPARRILEEMARYTEELPSKSARVYLNEMKGNYLVETGDWEGPFADIAVDVSDLNIVAVASQQLIEGVKAFRREDAAALETLIRELEDRRQAASLQITERGTPMCSAGVSRQAPNSLDLDRARVMELEMRGLYARLLGKPELADRWLREAGELERGLDYAYGPPEIPYPSYELYAEWLLEQGRPEEALQQFEYALQRGPRRIRALRGKLSAAGQLKDEKTVQEVQEILDEITGSVVSS